MRAPRASWLALLAALPGCDLPSAIPRYTTSWDVVIVRDSIAVAELLPEDLRVEAGGFAIDSYVVEQEILLGEFCEICTCYQGPLPPIELPARTWELELPGGLSSATIERGLMRVEIENRMGFDVLDDGAGSVGFLIVGLLDRRTDLVVRNGLLAGSFPPGTMRALEFDLAGLRLDRDLVAQLHGFVPGTQCDAELTPENGFAARVEVRDAFVRSAQVWAGDASLRIPQRSFELPPFVSSRLRDGEARVTVEVRVETRLPARVEIGVSAAGRPEDLFSAQAALYTPLLIPEGAPDVPAGVGRLYVVRTGALTGAERLYLDTRNRFLSPGPFELRGGESVRYEVRVRAEVPSR